MSLTAEQSYILSRKYVQATAEALGAVKGAPCQIQSIVDNPDGTHTITFSWESKSGVVQTDTMTVKNGASAYDLAVASGYEGTLEEWLESLKGVSIQSIEQTVVSLVDGGENEITITLTNGDTSTFVVRNGSGTDMEAITKQELAAMWED